VRLRSGALLRRRIKRLASRLKLLGVLYAGRSWLLNLRARISERRGLVVAADGLPLPPPRLRTLVAGAPDAVEFIENGQRTEDAIRAAVAAADRSFDDLRRILDFGCGCGRTLRRWAAVDAEVHGTDVNPALVEWCRENLTFATFSVNGALPPLALPPSGFDLVYAISVFTHLPEDAQRGWIGELRRLLAPDGVLVITTHGASHAAGLPREQRAAFERGELVVDYPGAAGSNICAAYHPSSWVRDRLAQDFEVAAHLPSRIDRQDVYAMRPA
jgi:SAM-dependent methyltransferase